MLANESEAGELARKLAKTSKRLSSPLALYEAVLAISRIIQVPAKEAEHVVSELMRRKAIAIVDITPDIGSGAIAAFERFGKGRHQARLNLGDCFAYACAKHHRVPILCRGNDFDLTDIKIA